MQLFTIGYQRRSPEDLLTELQGAGVELLLDVRAAPQSRMRGFSRGPLRDALELAGIVYRHEPRFGTPRPVRDAYHRSGDWVAFADAYRKQLGTQEDLLAAYCAELKAMGRVCLLCLEADPAECHRSLLAEELEARLGIEPTHL